MGGLESQGLSGLQGKFKAVLGNLPRSYLKIKSKNRNRDIA